MEPMERARRARAMRDEGASLGDIAKALGCSRATAMRDCRGEDPPPDAPPQRRAPAVPKAAAAPPVPHLRIVPAPPPEEVAHVVAVARAAAPDLESAVRAWSLHLSDEQVAFRLGLHPRALDRLLRQGEEDEVRGDRTDAAVWWLARGMAKAGAVAVIAERMLELVEHPDPKIAIQAQRFLLERVGGAPFAPPAPVQVNVNQGVQVNAAGQRTGGLTEVLAAVHARRTARGVDLDQVAEVTA